MRAILGGVTLWLGKQAFIYVAIPLMKTFAEMVAMLLACVFAMWLHGAPVVVDEFSGKWTQMAVAGGLPTILERYMTWGTRIVGWAVVITGWVLWVHITHWLFWLFF